jgi:hypothetical protein
MGGLTFENFCSILNLVKGAADTTLNGLSLYKNSVTCVSGTGETGAEFEKFHSLTIDVAG